MTGLVGGTVPSVALRTGATPPNYDAGKTQDQGDTIFTGLVNRGLGGVGGVHQAVTKKFWGLSNFSSSTDVGLKNNLPNYATYGTKVIMCLQPAVTFGLPLGSDFTTSGTAAQKNQAAADKVSLAAFLTSLANMGFTAATAQIVLWQEPTNTQNLGRNGQVEGPIDYNNMLRTYGGVVNAAHGGVTFPLVVNVNYEGQVSHATNYANAALGLRAYGGAGAVGLPAIAGICMDFYTNNYYGHSLRLDTPDANGDSISGIADAAGVPFGINEFGCCPTTIDPNPQPVPPYPRCTAYMQYILSFMKARLNAGKTNLDVIYYDGQGNPTGAGDITSPIGQDPFCVPTGASEFRVRLYQRIFDGLTTAATPSFTHVQTSNSFTSATGSVALWFSQGGGVASTRGTMLRAVLEVNDCTSAGNITAPAGWVQVADGKAGSANGQARAQVWYLPNNAGALAGVVGTAFTFSAANGSATVSGCLSEFSTAAATLQVADRAGTAGAVASATSLPVTASAADAFTGELGAAVFAAVLSGGTTGQSFTTPAGWTAGGSSVNAAAVYASYYDTTLGAGTASVTGTVTLGTWTMTSWAAALATFYATAALDLNIGTAALPGGVVGTAYPAGTAVVAQGGVAPYTFSAAGALPTGLSLNTATGAITGTPTVAGTYNFTVTATDCSQQSVVQPLTIVVTATASTLTIPPQTLPGDTVGVPYTATLTATGGSL